MTSWINRSDEALMDMRKKLATAPGASSSESKIIPHTNSILAASPQSEIERSGHGWCHDHEQEEAINVKLVEKALLDLFTEDALQSVDRSHGKDAPKSPKAARF